MANNRKYKTNPELLLAQGKAIVAAGDEARYQHKVEMVNLVLAGLERFRCDFRILIFCDEIPA